MHRPQVCPSPWAAVLRFTSRSHTAPCGVVTAAAHPPRGSQHGWKRKPRRSSEDGPGAQAGWTSAWRGVRGATTGRGTPARRSPSLHAAEKPGLAERPRPGKGRSASLEHTGTWHRALITASSSPLYHSRRPGAVTGRRGQLSWVGRSPHPVCLQGVAGRLRLLCPTPQTFPEPGDLAPSPSHTSEWTHSCVHRWRVCCNG